MAVHLTDMEELIAQIARSESRDYMSGSTDYLVETGARSSPPQWK